MTKNPHTQTLAQNITVDYDASTVDVDNTRLPWMLAAPGPIVTANADPDSTMGTVTVALFANEITVRGIPTPGTARPHTGATHVRLWDSDWNLVGDIDEGWRADQPLAVVLDREHPIARRVLDDASTSTGCKLTVDRDGNRIHGWLCKWTVTRTRLGDLVTLTFEEGV
ncbi:hypothetical protein [Rhodococcoides fascians]|uniref:hypothetical protein n=1 Tax=Rhodococcoides fascians TaxID=1828 RepID=UPI00055E6397|nr:MULTISPECIES: hypothetical protein [Rhodococcus]OZE98092.1 hypothetical protein CH301_17260 [Rhodococcus sp. 15-1189-1-1a]OZF12742.1 hypothetical protein CH299_17945 [Rhodococcus sp. 14-2686-1-2]